jgi:hypothetical protein
VCGDRSTHASRDLRRRPRREAFRERFDHDGIDVVHLAADASAVTVVVNEGDAERVGAVFSRFYQQQHG